ncbi:MAG: hypothetical protein AB1414_01240 [bacterium]
MVDKAKLKNKLRRLKFRLMVRREIGYCKDYKSYQKVYQVVHKNYRMLVCQKCHKVLVSYFTVEGE